MQNRKNSVRAQLVLVCISFVSLVLMICTIGSVVSEFKTLLTDAHSHFHRYCQSKRMDALGIAALFEWSLILSLIGGVPFVHLDVRAHFSLQSVQETEIAQET